MEQLKRAVMTVMIRCYHERNSLGIRHTDLRVHQVGEHQRHAAAFALAAVDEDAPGRGHGEPAGG